MPQGEKSQIIYKITVLFLEAVIELRLQGNRGNCTEDHKPLQQKTGHMDSFHLWWMGRSGSQKWAKGNTWSLSIFWKARCGLLWELRIPWSLQGQENLHPFSSLLMLLSQLLKRRIWGQGRRPERVPLWPRIWEWKPVCAPEPPWV